MTRIVVLGDLNIDIHARIPGSLFPGDELRDNIVIRPGGSAGTFARTATQRGASVTFIGTVGGDLAGDLLASSLTQAGVDAKLQRCKSNSGAVLAIQHGNERSMVCSRGANDSLTADWVLESFPLDCGHLHVSGYTLLSESQCKSALRAFDLASELGMSMSVDPPPGNLIRTFGVEDFLSQLPVGTWLFPNLSEGQLLSGKTAPSSVIDTLSRRFPIGALTLGAEGAIAWSGPSRHVQSSNPVANVDTTGAGDVFAAVFVVEYLASATLAKAVAQACKASWSMLQDRLISGA
jgi:ribokinase